ncbi:PREDICTED: CASP-like protein 2D1 [Theobroma cacao]|uniref:CASP-like protein n=1 Tax=Theobroma cacao TaxID=3641 RepID=A0AB32UX34_THECC|nr:PREDICTED: CASP-like protein 2D1 [Theobroma cacao]
MSSNIEDDTTSSNNHNPVLKFLDCSLRLSVVPLSAATICLTVTNKEDDSMYGEVKFSNVLGLKYMVCISAICAGYAFLAVVASCIGCLVTKAWLFFVSDQIIAYLVVTSGAAVMEIVYLAYNGDQKITWSEACGTYGKFCNGMKVALILHALVLCCFIVLAVISAYRVFSLFEPPFSSEDVQEERT